MSLIRILDFETSGLEPPQAKVCEIGTCDISLEDDGSWTLDPEGYASDLCGVDEMLAEVRAVHHISLAEVRDLEPFDPLKHFWGPATGLGVTVVAAHNMAFEAKFLGNPQLPLLCTYKAALRVWPDAPSHKNGVLRYWLEDKGLIAPDDEECHPAHRAGPDAYVTAHVLLALLETGVSAREMVAWTKEPPLLPTCPIGAKFRGKPWDKVEMGFLAWMMNQADMEADLKWNAKREITRRREAGK